MTPDRSTKSAIISDRDRLIAEHIRFFDALKAEYGAFARIQAQRYAELHADNGRLRDRLGAYEGELRALKLSTSWRLTQPLRSLQGLLQKVLPGAATLARYRHMFGIKATIKRLAGFALGRRGAPPVLPTASGAVLVEIFDPLPDFTVNLENVATPLSLSRGVSQTEAVLAVLDGGRQKSLLFISGESHTPGHQYRVARYIEAARECGHLADWMRVEDLAEDVEPALIYDAIIIWRAPWGPTLEKFVNQMKERGKPIIFDVDDLMVEPDIVNTEFIDGIRSQMIPETIVKDHFSGVRKTMLAANICFAPTERLAYYMHLAIKPTYILCNGFDQATHDLSRKAARNWRRSKSDNRIRIGYAGGSRTHQKDFGVAIGAVARALREHPECLLVLFVQADSGIRLVDIEEYSVLVGLEDRIEWRPLQPLEKLPIELARFDINLAPLEVGNPFCESKSELKFFESALVETPTIASPTGPFRAAIEHGKTGFLALGEEDWYAYLKLLIGEPKTRARVGKEAYNSVLAKYGPVQRREKFGRVIDSLWGGRASATAFALEAKLTGCRERRPKVYPSDVIFINEGEYIAQVSVIVPLYNYENYIIEALESIKSQSIALLDLVIVDGNSTDNSLNSALKWVEGNFQRFNRCVLLRNKDNYGLGYCRNSGVDAADTQFYIPVDADNKLLPDCCEKLLKTIKQENAAFAYSTIQQFGSSRALMGTYPYDPQRFVPDNYLDAMAMVSKEVWAMVGGYEHLRGGWEDYDFWAKIAENGLVGVRCPEVLSQYRVHQQSMTHTQMIVPANLRGLQDTFKQRHPWVSLIKDHAAVRLLHQQALADLPPSQKRRFEILLPILRCPKTRQKLIYDQDTSRLVSVDAAASWAIQAGRPILMDVETVVVMSEDHISNDLPPEIMQMMTSTPGLVLNLSAGGTRVKPENVIEAEFAVFRNTDVVTDAHSLPFHDEVFDLIISMNAFEHYKNPHTVASELRRVLKPGGRVLVRTAFLQPMHEAPWHFYNCTRYGLEHWFEAFEVETLHVSNNFNPVHTLAWVASDLEAGLRADVSDAAANEFKNASIDDFIKMWRSEDERQKPLWRNFERLSQQKQDITAAGFEMIAHKPADKPIL